MEKLIIGSRGSKLALKYAEIAKKAYTENITLKDAAIKLNYLDAKEFDLIVDPKRMIKGD